MWKVSASALRHVGTWAPRVEEAAGVPASSAAAQAEWATGLRGRVPEGGSALNLQLCSQWRLALCVRRCLVAPEQWNLLSSGGVC